MSKQIEALKLALEALELVNIEFVCNGAHHAKKDRHSLDEDCPVTMRYRTAITAIKEALAQPEQEPSCAECGAGNGHALYCVACAEKFVGGYKEQEPVAWMHNHIEGNVIAHRPADIDRRPDHWTALYPEPKPCPTCEALARTVMLDQTSHDTPPQRKLLTDEKICLIAHNTDPGDWNNLNLKDSWHSGFKQGFKTAEIEYGVKHE